LPWLKLLSLVIGCVAVVLFLVLADRAEAARLAGAPEGEPLPLTTRLLVSAIVITPNLLLSLLLWRTGWGNWLHERTHGFAMSRLGAEPTYGVYLDERWTRGNFCVPRERRLFSRATFSLIAIAPALLPFALGVLLSLVSVFSVLVTVALAVQLSSCSGDVWFLWVTLRAPGGSEIEDLGTAMIVHPPCCESMG
jgi:hypothetical protein